MAEVIWSGVDELLEQLRDLPDHLAAEAGSIVQGAADNAMSAMAAAYAQHVVSGKLERSLKKTEQAIGRYGVAYQVKNTAPHAWMYENGTIARHNKKGANRGAAPPRHAFVPNAERSRAAMYQQLRAMLEREGFTVTGG